MGISSGERVAAAGGGLAELAARPHGYPWMGISSGERVAAAGGGLAELAARPPPAALSGTL